MCSTQITRLSVHDFKAMARLSQTFSRFTSHSHISRNLITITRAYNQPTANYCLAGKRVVCEHIVTALKNLHKGQSAIFVSKTHAEVCLYLAWHRETGSYDLICASGEVKKCAKKNF